MHIEIKHFRRLQPGIADIVRVADPCHGFAVNAAAMLEGFSEEDEDGNATESEEDSAGEESSEEY